VLLAALGATAHAALEAGGGLVTVFAALTQSIYCRVGDEIVWLGPATATLHPRAMLTRAPLETGRWREGETLGVDAGRLVPWQPPRADTRTASRTMLVASARALLGARHRLPPPDGFGALLGAGTPAFPLHEARPRACALADAIASEDADSATDAAIALLGLGPGLTPSGDDFVGGAFFARAFAADVAGIAAHRSRETIARVLASASTLTNPISIALLADMLHGRGHAPLHELANALATGVLDGAIDAAARLARLGHCSGWDILAGFLGGTLGSRAFVA
jgi:hypothetical protein